MPKKYLKISANCKENLGLPQIIEIIDKTSCQMGKRCLQDAINFPLCDKEEIDLRLDAVEFLLTDKDLLEQLLNQLKNLPDLEEIIKKVNANKNANVQELELILNSLQIMAKITEILFWKNNNENISNKFLLGKFSSSKLLTISQNLHINFSLIKLLNSALEDNKIKIGFSPKFDYLKKLIEENYQKISELEKQYQNLTLIKDLKIKFDPLIGFYFEIKRDQLCKIKVPTHWQLLQNLDFSVRFSSIFLKNYQLEIADLKVKIKHIKQEILQDLSLQVLQNFNQIENNCNTVATLDLLASFAILAKENNYVKPQITNQNTIKIIAGYHPIFKQFINNDCFLGQGNIFLITGSNMAGKSAFLQQNAIIVIFAQCGCFVPAKIAEIGLREAIFVKTIVNDNLFQNLSESKAEMLQLAEILKNSNEKSLVIIDEIYRNNASKNKDQLAFAIIKYLAQYIKALALISSCDFNLAINCQNLSFVICKKINKEHIIADEIEPDLLPDLINLEMDENQNFPKQFLQLIQQNLKIK